MSWVAMSRGGFRKSKRFATSGGAGVVAGGGAVLGPDPDRYPPRSDKNRISRTFVIRMLDQFFANQNWTNRDCRHIVRGGGPQQPPHLPYQHSFFKYVLNRFSMPELFEAEELHNFVGCFHLELYSMVQDYIRPLLLGAGPGDCTLHSPA